MLLFLPVSGAGCVSREAPRSDPAAKQFDAGWQRAETLDACIRRLDSAIAPGLAMGQDRPSSVLLSAAFWPDEAARFTDLPGPTSKASLWERRLPELLSISMAVIDGHASHPLLKPEACRWLVYSGLREDWAPVGEGAALGTGNISGAAEMRVVFRIAVAPRALQGTRHGEALEVTAWGLGLEVHAAQMLDARGRILRHWFHKS
ncbi:MAG: hypothetical protein IPK87_09765 [Planctomycetes bacterium]|nr:hypothetical protein [Planctomycetota bacterium]